MRLYEWMIGWRYVRPRARRGFVSFISAISMLGITVAVTVLIVVLSVMNGFEIELRDRILSMASHASVTGFDGRLEQWSLVRDQGLSHPHVEAAAPFVEGEGMLVRDDRLSGVLVRGIDPAQERTVVELDRLMQQGAVSDLVSGEYRILIGTSLAKALGVAPGDRLILLTPKARITPAGIAPVMRRFVVSGVFAAGMHEFDRGLAFVHIADAARLFGLGDAVTGIRFRLDDMFLAPQVVLEIARGIGGGVLVSDWTRQHVNFFRSIKLTKSVLFVILLLVVGVAAFNIVSTLVMVVRDKQSDIAIMRTYGVTPRSVMGIFVIQGTVIGTIGTLAGVLLGVLTALNIEALVRGLEQFLSIELVSAEVYFIGDLPAQIRPEDIVLIGVTAFGLTVLSTLYPAWRAARTQPAEALRHE